MKEHSHSVCGIGRFIGAAWAATLVVATTAIVSAQTDPPSGCPSYTHKEVAPVGSPAQLPEGWYVFSKANQGDIVGGVFTGTVLPGIYRSPIRTYTPQLVPNTDDQAAETIEISDDGQWLVYLGRSDRKVYVIRVDGEAKTAVPTSGSTSLQCGFYRSGPNGVEIWYLPDNEHLRSVTVTLAESKATFGSDRVLADLSGSGKIFGQGAGQTSVAKDQIFARIKSTSRFLTIPDGGKGTATFSYPGYLGIDPGRDVSPGCGETMSHDGAYCAANPGNAGRGSGCVPDPDSRFDHKGFAVHPFLRAGSGVSHHDLYLVNGHSINWCPKEYRFGTYSEMEFHEYYFGNNSDYVMCVKRGSKSTDFGVWIVHWRSNTWTRVSDENQVADGPAVFFTGATRATPAVHRIAGARGALGPEALYDIRGRRLGGSRVTRLLVVASMHGPTVAISGNVAVSTGR